jgi:hypothetical protein
MLPPGQLTRDGLPGSLDFYNEMMAYDLGDELTSDALPFAEQKRPIATRYGRDLEVCGAELSELGEDVALS